MRSVKSLLSKIQRSVSTITIIACAAALVVVSSGLFVTHRVATQRAVTQIKQSQTATDKALHQAAVTEATMQQQKKQAAAKNNPDTTVHPGGPNDPVAHNPNIVKYSTSSDPRSTAYSLTPPAPAAGSFSYTVTHAGQFAYGAPLYNNVTKHEKGFYAGDLTVSPSVVTISRSGSHNANVTVSGYNGQVIGMPSLPWDAPSSHIFIAMDSALYNATGGRGATLQMYMALSVYDGQPTNGTYQVRIVTGPVNPPTPDGWESDGFITVNVVD